MSWRSLDPRTRWMVAVLLPTIPTIVTLSLLRQYIASTLVGVIAFSALGVAYATLLEAGPDVRRPRLLMVRIGLMIVGALTLLFALLYLSLSTRDPLAFSEPLSPIDSLYFALTVLTTTGFGDIAPKSDAARLAVSLQMVVDLGVVAIVAARIVRVSGNG